MTIVLNNIRSCWNVGSIMRTCDAIGAKLILVGYTPKPIGQTLKMINKTAIGAEDSVVWKSFEHWQEVFNANSNNTNIAVEISNTSIDIVDFLKTSTTLELDKLFLWFGNEISGLEKDLTNKCNFEVHLPMSGIKESLNIATSVTAFAYILDTYSRLSN
ncbi:MAG: RNA methyltransferase [Thermales bacterium]|nr:RNA methyltransferase [Thermales bacterium]